MNSIFYKPDTISKTTSTVAAETQVYCQPVNATVYSSLMPTSGHSFIPTAAIVYQLPVRKEAEVLVELGALGQNWDGYDAHPINVDACAAATRFLNALPPSFASPDISPNPSGTISMDWALANSNAQLEFGRSRFSFYLRRAGSPTLYHKGEIKCASDVYALLRVLDVNPRPESVTQIQY